VSHKPEIPELARALRDRLAEAFAKSIHGELAAADEILDHQLAATSDREKWRPLRLAREVLRDLGHGLTLRLDARIKARFDAKLAPEEDTFSQTARFTLDSLSLVSESEVQEEIAVGNAARRMREATGDEFFAANARLAEVLGHGPIPEDRSPAHPRVFARALLDVLAQATEDGAARLAAFAAFDPAMLHALPKAYKAGNDFLADQGVLPHFRRQYGAPQQVPGARPASHGMDHGEAAPQAAAAAPPHPGGKQPPAPAAPAPPPPQALFDRLLASAATVPAPSQPGLVTVHVRPELAQALHRLESRLAALSADLGQAALPDETAASVPPTADVVRRARDQLADALTPADMAVADLLAAMFGRLFTDPELADAAKVQLGRLQLPVFKAVMTDRRFFTEPDHPIRALIDTIAELGAAGDEFEIDGRLPVEWVAQETQRLLEAEHLDLEAFAAARDRLAAVATQLHEVLADMDAVVHDVRREDADIKANQEAALEVAHRIAASGCPKPTAVYLYRTWRPVLAHDYRVMGAGTPPWNADVETLDDLLWVLSPRPAKADRERLATLLPSARFRLWQGLIRAQVPSEDIESLLDQFDRLQADMQRAPIAAVQAEAAAGLSAAMADDFTATLHVSSDAVQEEGIARGAWFEFTEDDGTLARARVAWVSPVQGACVFKDVARNRSFAMSLADLRQRREAGRARPVDGPGVAHACIEGALADVARERGLEGGVPV
jgi:hypothetical protein